MIDIKAIWEIYKCSDAGKEALNRFENPAPEDLAKFYNPEYAALIKPGVITDIAETLYYYGFSEMPSPDSTEEAKLCLSNIGCFGVAEEGEWVIQPGDFETLSAIIVPLSLSLIHI